MAVSRRRFLGGRRAFGFFFAGGLFKYPYRLCRISFPKLGECYLYSRLILNNQGKDLSATNWGSNIFLSNGSRQMDYENKIGQGIATDVSNFTFTATYMLAHNIFTDLTVTHRNLTSEKEIRNMKSTYIALAFRMNIGRKDQGY